MSCKVVSKNRHPGQTDLRRPHAAFRIDSAVRFSKRILLVGLDHFEAGSFVVLVSPADVFPPKCHEWYDVLSH